MNLSIISVLAQFPPCVSLRIRLGFVSDVGIDLSSNVPAKTAKTVYLLSSTE